MESSVFLDGEFINLYTADNPILNEGDTCYALIFNTKAWHRPIVIRGVIIQDKFSDGMNKQYYVRILEIIESPVAIKKFVIGQSFITYPYYNETLHTRKQIMITPNTNYNYYLFKIEAFFVRNTLDKILEVRKKYISVVQSDLQDMLADVKNLELE